MTLCYNKNMPHRKYTNITEEQWLATLTPAQLQFRNWMIECDGKARTTARDYVNFVGECSIYVGKLLGLEADFYALGAARQVARLKELLYSNTVFQQHSSAFPTLKSALNKYTQYMETKNNTKPFPFTPNRKDTFKEWLLANDYKENTATNYAYNVQRCSDFMSEHIEKYDFYCAQGKAELKQQAHRLLNDRTFRDMDIKLHAQCSNALKRYCEFMDSL